TFNEEDNIRPACESVSWADEILVVDSESTDRTRQVATECGARVISRPWPGFSAQKQFATDAAAHDWGLSLDADELVSPELRSSITSLYQSQQNPNVDGYRAARRTFYMNRWIKGGGWYPNHQLRLFDRRRGHWRERLIHESVVMNDGALTETLTGDILHYT